MKLELANGEMSEIADINEVYSAIDRLDNENGHLILSDGDSYIQTAWLGNDLYETEYRDKTGYFQAVNQDQGISMLKKIFEGFYNKDGGWKDLTPWELIENNENSSSSSDTGSTTGRSGDFKEDIAEQLKREALNWGKRKLKKFLKF